MLRYIIMDITTIRHLNAINREFYRITGDEFDATRGQAWNGWGKIRTYIMPPLRILPKDIPPLHVLDVGCGNGRFGVYLAGYPGGLFYHGVDNSPLLLDRA